MINEKEDFIQALENYVRSEISQATEPAEYNNESIQIIDARNHLFKNVGKHVTDEEMGIYALRDLCLVDEDTMQMCPNRSRFAAIAKEYGLA